eukprot:jgi/Chlat1/531/Chrsp103S01114
MVATTASSAQTLRLPSTVAAASRPASRRSPALRSSSSRRPAALSRRLPAVISSCRSLVRCSAAGAVSNSNDAGASNTDNIKYVYTGKEVKELIEKEGYKLVDVRDATQYNRSHVPGSDNVPMWIANEGTDPSTLIKRLVYNGSLGYANGSVLTKPNPAFYRTIEQKYGKDAKLLLVCQEGFRSGEAVDKLEDLGFSNLAWLPSGFRKIQPGELPKEGKSELFRADIGGFTAIQSQISFAIAFVLIGLYIVSMLAPEAAEKFLQEHGF